VLAGLLARSGKQRAVPSGTLFHLSDRFPALPRRAFTCRRFAAGVRTGLLPLWGLLVFFPNRHPRLAWAGFFRRFAAGTGAPALQKENRAGWPGFFCVELDAVTSQRGATGAEGAFVLLRRVHRSKDLTGKRKPTDGWVQAACHASTSFDFNPQVIVSIGLAWRRLRRAFRDYCFTAGGSGAKFCNKLHMKLCIHSKILVARAET